MSIGRLPALTAQPLPTAQPTRDIRAAQRAFFQAATTQQPAPSPAATKASPVVDPERPLRPGSLLDIRV